MSKKRLIVTSVISIVLVAVLMLGSTYSIFTSTEVDETENVYTTGDLNVTYTLSEDNIILSNSIPMDNSEVCGLEPYRITVTNNGNVPYKFNLILNNTTASDAIASQYINVQVGQLSSKTLGSTTNNVIEEGIVILPNTSVDIDVRVWISNSVANSEMNKSFYAKLAIDGLAVYDDREVIDNSNLIAVDCLANSPNLDGSNLIPVYYSSSYKYDVNGDGDTSDSGETFKDVWIKADSSNTDNVWYNYNKKDWANAVIIGDETKKATYLEAEVGTPIDDEDITAFYVWIPRFKYRVWNITRQGGVESTYAYSAYTNGIDIKFESGTATTGNVECAYNIGTVESTTNLSDVCVYNGTDTITTTSGNKNYKHAWYTHPAFTFGDKELEGFWIGKFETTGSDTEPTILPNEISINKQTVSGFFTISKLFQNYLSSNLDAHSLTNLEWGAVSYLTHSIYGRCNNTGCKGVYINNSSGVYTGRSGGDIAGNVSDLATFYGDTSDSSANKYNAYGYYDYMGYMLNSLGAATSTKDLTKLASTTGNITGVYDMAGGRFDSVMANMVDANYNFYPVNAGEVWNGSTVLADKYYNSYSYGNSYSGVKAANRSRLGDGIGEVLGGTGTTSAWKVGSGVTGATSYVIAENSSNYYVWMYRGSQNDVSTGSMLSFSRYTGHGTSSNVTFRSALS